MERKDLFDASNFNTVPGAQIAIKTLQGRMGRQSRMGEGALKDQIQHLSLRVKFLEGNVNVTDTLYMRNLWLKSIISTGEFIEATGEYPCAIGPEIAVAAGWYDEPEAAVDFTLYDAPIGPLPAPRVNPEWIAAFKIANGANSKMSLASLINSTVSIPVYL